MNIERKDPLTHLMPGPPIAVLAESLFLINLMLLPGLAFVLLLLLWWRYHDHADPLVRNHLRQTVVTCIWGGGLLVSISVAIFALGGLDNPWSWVIGVLYFVLFHAGLIYLGVMGLVRAINGHSWRYPLVGPHRDD